MKIKLILWTAVLLFSFSPAPSFAIEGLTLSIQGSNAVLSMPSVEGETFIIQRRASLDTNDTWQTLTNFYPAAMGTNVTSFVDSNAVCVPVGGGESRGEGGDVPPAPGNYSSFQNNEEFSFPPLPPLPWETKTSDSTSRNFNSEGFSSEEESSGNGVCAGFYQVARNGIYFIGLTNDATLSGATNLVIEAGQEEGALECVTINSDGLALEGTEMLSKPFPFPLSFQVDTTRIANGTHSFQANGTFTVFRNNTLESPFVRLSGQSVSVNETSEKPTKLPEKIFMRNRETHEICENLQISFRVVRIFRG